MNFGLLKNKGNLLCNLRPAGFKILFSVQLVNTACCCLGFYLRVPISTGHGLILVKAGFKFPMFLAKLLSCSVKHCPFWGDLTPLYGTQKFC